MITKIENLFNNGYSHLQLDTTLDKNIICLYRVYNEDNHRKLIMYFILGKNTLGIIIKKC